MEFSPHTRGCSEATLIERIKEAVFPAYAGMFPGIATLGWDGNEFSPHTRGCS